MEEEEAAEESDGDEMGVEFIWKPELHGGPVIFQNLSGVHGGYEETKTFLDIPPCYQQIQLLERHIELERTQENQFNMWEIAFLKIILHLTAYW